LLFHSLDSEVKKFMCPNRKLVSVLALVAISNANLEVKEECSSETHPVERGMTEDELADFNGAVIDRPIYISYLGQVYDVSSEAATYGPSGNYEVFAGRACTRGVALPSLRLRDVSDDIDDLVSEEQVASLSHWESFFQNKYLVVATLVPDSVDARRSRVARYVAAHEAVVAAKAEATEAKAALNPSGKVFTVSELKRFDGSPDAPSRALLLAIGGHVLDVSRSAFLYGKEKPRGCFVGRDITRVSSLQGVKGLSPCDAMELSRGSDLGGLSSMQLVSLQKRVDFFLAKFPKVGEMAKLDES